PFHDLAAVIDQNQVGGTNFAEVHPEGIDPKMIEALRITGRDMAGYSLIESEAREQPVCAGQPLLAMTTLRFRGGKNRRCGQVESTLCSDWHHYLTRLRTNYSAALRGSQRRGSQPQCVRLY